MAAVWAFRVAIALAGVGVKVISSSSGPGAPHVVAFGQDVWDFVNDPFGNGDEFWAAYAARTGYGVAMANYEGTFELRLAQVHWARDSGAAAGTDDAVTTHHFIKLAGAAPAAWVDGTDLAALETKFTTWWDAIKTKWPPSMALKQIRWYRAGPGIGPPNPPLRTTTLDSPGVGGTSPLLPPQCAMSVTEKTTDPKSWGRFYMPLGVASTWMTNDGRLDTTQIDEVMTATDAFYEACRTSSTPCVVYSAAKPERETKAGTTLDAVAARALGVDFLQIDDLVDIQRSRRWNEPLVRNVEPVGA